VFRLLGFALILSLSLPQLLRGQTTPTPPRTPSNADDELALKFSKVKRIYIEPFGEEATAKQAQAAVVDALSKSHRFIVTENKEKADAILKGVATEKSSHELHSTSEGTAVRGAAIADSETSTQTINEAHLVVRVVSVDGDVLWSTTQESKGGKYKGATADAADKVVKQLLWDLDKLQKPAHP
jgi:hypothetical protein